MKSKPRVYLFDGPLTIAQQGILLLWGVLLASVVALWAPLGVRMLTGGDLDQVFISIADILGLLATFFALTQFMLMGRITWIERAFGLDRLASYHRTNGYLAISLIVVHPIFITLHHMVEDQTNPVTAFLTIFSEHAYTIWALVAELLFIAVVLSSMYIARRHLRFETWYYVHLMVYLAIILASLHQFANGTSLISDAARYYWLGLYVFVALNVVIWRFGLVVYNSWRFKFVISRVVHETPTVTSIYIKARGLPRLRVKPGQFILVRLLTRTLWWQEHPFTVSWMPKGNELRISVRDVGDYTSLLQHVKPGVRVVVSGPLGRFTSDVAVTPKRLFVAGGIGITPLRALSEQADKEGIDAVLLYANRVSKDVPLKREIDALGLKTVYVYSEERVQKVEHGRIDVKRIKRLVPDFLQRDIYLCGPPAMMSALITQLTDAGLPPEQLHYEVFQLHP